MNPNTYTNGDKSDDAMRHRKYHLHTYVITLNIDMDPSQTFLPDLRDKYYSILNTLLETDSKIIPCTAYLDNKSDDTKKSEYITRKMASMVKYFYTTLKSHKKDVSHIWITARIATNKAFKDICTATTNSLAEDDTVLMKKIF